MMATLNAAFLKALAPKAPQSTLDGIVASLPALMRAGISEPLVLAHFLSQLLHESGGFRFLVEIWGKNGGTEAQQRYDIRTNLGNTPERDGDGFKYRGRGLIQLTGKANYRSFTKWYGLHFNGGPDFVKDPDLVATFPYAILAAAWFWQSRNLTPIALSPTSSSIDKITKLINGGYNGLADRRAQFDRVALMMLDYGTDAVGVAAFQNKNPPLVPDGELGPKTRSALMTALSKIATKQEIANTNIAWTNTLDRNAWKPNKSDFIGNAISYGIWVIGQFIKLKVFGKLS